MSTPSRFVVKRVIDNKYEIGSLADKAKLKRQIMLASADPFDLTNPTVRRALCNAVMRLKETDHYTRIRGLPDFVESVSEFYLRFNVRVDPESEVLVTNGSNEGLFITFFALSSPGAEFILPNPTYPDFAWILEIVGAVPRFVAVKSDYHLDLSAIEKAVNERTKAIVLCSPNNPTGAAYTEDELGSVLELARRKDLMIVCDENFSVFTYGRRHFSLGSVPGSFENLILVNGLSKAFGMAGWRLGYLIARESILEELEKVAYCMRESVNTAAQYAGATALRTSQTTLDKLRRDYERRRDLIIELLLDHGFHCHVPEAGFMVFPRIPDKFDNSVQFAKFLQQKAGVVVNPGRIFGPKGDRNFRMVYCKSDNELRDAFKKISLVRTW